MESSSTWLYSMSMPSMSPLVHPSLEPCLPTWGRRRLRLLGEAVDRSKWKRICQDTIRLPMLSGIFCEPTVACSNAHDWFAIIASDLMIIKPARGWPVLMADYCWSGHMYVAYLYIWCCLFFDDIYCDYRKYWKSIIYSYVLSNSNSLLFNARALLWLLLFCIGIYHKNLFELHHVNFST